MNQNTLENAVTRAAARQAARLLGSHGYRFEGDTVVLNAMFALADASAHNLDRVEIVHGHGTGALGRRISQHLKSHQFVQSYRYGEPQEGGSGVTIVEIK